MGKSVTIRPAGGSPAGLNDLEHGVDVGRLALDLDSEHGEQEHLHRSTGRIPERTGHAKLPCHVGALKQRRSPAMHLLDQESIVSCKLDSRMAKGSPHTHLMHATCN
jgi:hypothetical protein